MLLFTRLLRSPALALCLSTTAAQADLTAADLWTEWRDYASSTGYYISAREVTDSDGLTLNNLSMRMDLEETSGNSTVNIKMGTLRFIENADGSVSVALPTSSDIEVRIREETGENVSFTIATTMTSPVFTATGDPGNVIYDFEAQSVNMDMLDLTFDGVTLGPELTAANFSLQDLAYVTRSVRGGLRMIDQSGSASTATYKINLSDPMSDETFKMDGQMRDITFEGGGAFPEGADMQDINAMLNAGFEFGGTFTTSGGAYDLTFRSDDGSGTINTTSEGTELETRFGSDGIAYSVSQVGVTINTLMTELPLPLSFSADEISTNFLLPVQKSDSEQDFGLGFALTGLTVSDTIWGLFDPAVQLPRDPINLIFDLGGTAKLLFDFLDPDQGEILAETGAVPGELISLKLNAIEVKAAGAELAGQGAFTFDNGDLITFDGMPRPKGAIDLTLVGGNGLLDTLIDMGLVPASEAMGMRMMMGLFAVPSEGEDTLGSRIEVNSEGHVLANGQRLR
ncbi:MAG: hypothetical protein P8N30_12735 [Tateyamaria sp.]|jgi:hypothetical protein|nr:hypothetical protein [Tateyamaria sp.]MDG1336110.1 hypothetical protein [Tateyamaria sp.]